MATSTTSGRYVTLWIRPTSPIAPRGNQHQLPALFPSADNAQVPADEHRIASGTWDAHPITGRFEMAYEMAYTTVSHRKDPLRPAGM